MAKGPSPIPIKKGDKRTGDDLVRTWVEGFPNVHQAELASGLMHGHLRLWLDDPDRGLLPESALKLALAVGVPVESVLFRWTPVNRLNMWRWVKKAAAA